MMSQTCKDCGEPADPEYTMDFTDVEPGAYIYWCVACGPEAKMMNEALTEALSTRGPGFVKELETAIEKAEQEIH